MLANLVLEVITRAPILLREPETSTSTDVWAPLNNLKDLLLTGCASVGVIVLIIGVIQFATSYVSHDNSQKITAIWVFVAGAMLIGAAAILGAIVKT